MLDFKKKKKMAKAHFLPSFGHKSTKYPRNNSNASKHRFISTRDACYKTLLVGTNTINKRFLLIAPYFSGKNHVCNKISKTSAEPRSYYFILTYNELTLTSCKNIMRF